MREVIVHCSFLDMHRTAGVVPNEIVTIQNIFFYRGKGSHSVQYQLLRTMFLANLVPLGLENVCSDAALMYGISMDIIVTADMSSV